MVLAQLPLLDRLIPASALPAARSHTSIWSLAGLAGRLVELSGDASAARLTAAFGLVLEAQVSGDDGAWITLEHSSFFPPDVVDSGVDLNALPVVRVPDARRAGRAVDHLVRSGGFGLVVVDLSSGIETKPELTQATNKLPMPLLMRLAGLARQRNVAVLFLTKKSHEDLSLHSLISLRAEARWQRREDQYELSVRVLRDKQGGKNRCGLYYKEIYRGPAGLR